MGNIFVIMANYLLIRDQVGQQKQPTQGDLPSINHAYGKPYRKDSHNAAALLSSWHNHTNTTPMQQPHDYKRMNKAAVISKVTTARGATDFRTQMNLILPAKYEHRPKGMQNCLSHRQV